MTAQRYPACDGDCGDNGIYCCDGGWDASQPSALQTAIAGLRRENDHAYAAARIGGNLLGKALA